MLTTNHQLTGKLTPAQALLKRLMQRSKLSLLQIAKELNMQSDHLKKIWDGEIKVPQSKTFQKLLRNKYLK